MAETVLGGALRVSDSGVWSAVDGEKSSVDGGHFVCGGWRFCVSNLSEEDAWACGSMMYSIRKEDVKESKRCLGMVEVDLRSMRS